ncbi:hypothetical protein OG239_03000 [Streptomyces sp. NBC_00868]|uniref:hypothetical protein n=1 Tax=Streptomyces sp. NBC_00868 TaxID=2903683 RepID=UPI00386502A8|nr:hypothetical protein OG239_03000 [Streptomyces sp. NBC_00868]
MAEDSAAVDGPVCADLRHHLRADRDRVQDVTAAPAVAKRTPVHGCTGPAERTPLRRRQ